MSLSPEGLRDILMTSTMAYFDQMQKDIEVRIATVLVVRDTGLNRPTMQIIAEEASRAIVKCLRDTVILSGELDRVVGKLI